MLFLALMLLLDTSGGNYAEIGVRKKMSLAEQIRKRQWQLLVLRIMSET